MHGIGVYVNFTDFMVTLLCLKFYSFHSKDTSKTEIAKPQNYRHHSNFKNVPPTPSLDNDL